MKISTKGRYALRLMLDLAEHGTDKYIALKDIAHRQQISVKYLEQIVTSLSRAGFLKSLRGPQGGYKLSRQPVQYKVGAILRVTEGCIEPVVCLEDESNQCIRHGQCLTVGFWRGLQETINDYIDTYTLADLLQDKSKN
ncbi:MAG: RrF2 family transcriptional regulator [Bacillota bacterium]|jgi:Rrf2 family protein